MGNISRAARIDRARKILAAVGDVGAPIVETTPGHGGLRRRDVERLVGSGEAEWLADGARARLRALPVVDGDGGCIDVYGNAKTAEEALSIARDQFVDHIDRVELCGPVTLRDGSTVKAAWLAIVAEAA